MNYQIIHIAGIENGIRILQAEWLEQIYTIMYSKPWIEAINWYDFVDPYSFIKNGGLLADVEGNKKEAFNRLKSLKESMAVNAKK